MNRASKSIDYFRLGEKYLNSTKKMLKTIIENENQTCGFGNTEKEAEDDMLLKTENSDVTLFIPSMFCLCQGFELYIKALLLIKNPNFNTKKGNHEIENMIVDICNNYGENSSIYLIINQINNYWVEIINDYKTENHIETTKELYISFRYPENNKKKFKYDLLTMNGLKVLDQYQSIINDIDMLQEEACNIYYSSKNK